MNVYAPPASDIVTSARTDRSPSPSASASTGGAIGTVKTGQNMVYKDKSIISTIRRFYGSSAVEIDVRSVFRDIFVLLYFLVLGTVAIHWCSTICSAASRIRTIGFVRVQNLMPSVDKSFRSLSEAVFLV